MRMTRDHTKSAFLCLIAILCGFAAALAAVLVNGVSLPAGNDPPEPPYELLSFSGWSVESGGTLRPTELPAYVPPEGGSLRIVNTLPRALETGTCLAFESVDTYVTVRVDGEEIYRNAEPGGQLRSMWNFVRLDASRAEGRVTLEFSGPDPFDTGTVPEIFLGPYTEILLVANSQLRVNSQAGITILLFGVFVLLFALASFSDSRYVTDFALLGVVIIVLGLSLGLQTVRPTGSAAARFVSQGIGASLFGLLPPFYCFYRGVRAGEGNGRPYFVTCGCGLAFYFLVFCLRWFGPSAFRPLARVAICLVFEGIYAICLYRTLRGEERDSRRYRLLVSLSLAALMLGIGLEGFTHLAATRLRTLRPIMAGALVFSLLHTVAVMLYVFEHAQRQVKMAEELSESRFRLMMNQLKPHFIRNSLATIRVIIRHDPQKAYDLLYDFANYISYNIDSMRETELTPFAEELKHIREYTNIQEEHMRHRLRMVYEPGPADFLIPPLSVEPFVENAVRHGVWPKREGGTVTVGSGETEDAYIITVRDDGVGFDPSDPPPPALRGHGIGMKYAVERIETMVNGTVRVESEPGKGTVVTITIPKRETEDEG